MKIGIDILQVARIKRIYENEKLMQSMFGQNEREYINNTDKRFDNLETVAGLYCAKEAFFKALGVGIQLSQLKEIQVVHDALGAPNYQLTEKIKKEYNIESTTLSISHTNENAVAVCVILFK